MHAHTKKEGYFMFVVEVKRREIGDSVRDFLEERGSVSLFC
jgi:hypothetical protein